MATKDRKPKSIAPAIEAMTDPAAIAEASENTVAQDISRIYSSPEEGPAGAWSPDEITALSQRVDALVEANESLSAQLQGSQGRIDRMEADLQAFDPSRALIPTRVLGDLTPSQIFQTILQGVVTANVMAYAPTLMSGDPKNRHGMVDKMISLTLSIYTATCDKIGVKDAPTKSGV
jgi:hypothetical protein